MSGIHMALLGAGDNVTIFLSNETVTDFTGGASDAFAGYRLLSTGDIQVTSGGSFTTIGQWCTPGSASSGYEARATISSGSITSGPIGSWVTLSTLQAWYNDAPVGTSVYGAFTLEIRDTATSTVRATATITLDADAT